MSPMSPPWSRQRPTASKFSSAKPTGSIVLWQLAHTGFVRCWLRRSRIGRPAATDVSSSTGTFAGGGGGEGAILRLIYTDGTKGPARVVQSGSGYRSANATTQVLGAAGEAVAIEVAWPSGKKTTVPLKPGQAEAVLSYPSEP